MISSLLLLFLSLLHSKALFTILLENTQWIIFQKNYPHWIKLFHLRLEKDYGNLQLIFNKMEGLGFKFIQMDINWKYYLQLKKFFRYQKLKLNGYHLNLSIECYCFSRIVTQSNKDIFKTIIHHWKYFNNFQLQKSQILMLWKIFYLKD